MALQKNVNRCLSQKSEPDINKSISSGEQNAQLLNETIAKGPHYHVMEREGMQIYTDVSQGNPHEHKFISSDGDAIVTTSNDDIPDHTHGAVINEDHWNSSPPITAVRTFDKSFDVITWEAVKAKRLPDLGTSGLPESLEADIPGKFKYWKCASIADALKVRESLVESEWLTPDNVRQITIKQDGEVIGKVWRRVELKEMQKMVLTTVEDGEPEVPQDIKFIEKAAKLVGLNSDARKFEANIVDDIGLEYLLKTMTSVGRDWIFEIKKGSASEDLLAKRADKCTAFQLFNDDNYIYYSSGIPAEEKVNWWSKPNVTAAQLLKSRQNMKSAEITAAIPDLLIPEYISELSHASALIAKKISDFSTWDNRVATRSLMLLDQELGKGKEVNGDIVKGLGLDLQRATAIISKFTQIPIFKHQLHQQIVYGVVLEPGAVDLQGDTYTIEDVEKAYYSHMDSGGLIGLQHQEVITGKARIVQAFLAPSDFVPDGCQNGETIKKGSWVLAERILDQELWNKVLNGEITGFSIGGTGTRIPLN
jgi:hypothetical protein